MTVHTFPCAIYKPRILFVTSRSDWAATCKAYGRDFAYPLNSGGLASVSKISVKGYSPVLVIVANQARLRRNGHAAR